jgi:hypothetical protein
MDLSRFYTVKPKQARMDLERERRILDNGRWADRSGAWGCMIVIRCRGLVSKTRMVVTIDQGDSSAYCAAADNFTRHFPGNGFAYW